MLTLHHATHESSAAKVLRMLCDLKILKKLYIQFVLMSVLLSFLTDLYNVSACAWAFWKPGSENVRKTGQYQSAPWSGSHDYAGQQQGGSDARGSMEHRQRASFRWFVGMTGAPLIINLWQWCSGLLTHWYLKVGGEMKHLFAEVLEFVTWVKYLPAWFAGQHANAFCANLPIKAVRQKQSVCCSREL